MVQTRTRRHVCFVSIIEGDLATPMRERCESAFFERLSAARITISMVAVNDGGCVLAVDEYDLEGMQKAARSLNVALRVRSHCARVSVSKRGAPAPLPSVSTVIAAMAEEGIGIIHLAAGTNEVSILVDERDAVRTQVVLSRCAVPSPRSAA